MLKQSGPGPSTSDTHAPSPENPAPAFVDTNVWVFDLDNTLYPSKINLFAQVDARMGAFIADKLEVPLDHARYLQKSYYYKYGTTLCGLMNLHGIEPMEFLDYVHDIDLSAITPDQKLHAGINALPGRKFIFTNGANTHAQRVAEKLGVSDLFEDICAIEHRAFEPKPSHEAFLKMARAHDITLPKAAMFEDLPHNLKTAHELGMTTVLVVSSYNDHPSQKKIAAGADLPAHIHFKTENLPDFLHNGWLGHTN